MEGKRNLFIRSEMTEHCLISIGGGNSREKIEGYVCLEEASTSAFSTNNDVKVRNRTVR
jgi:hypothetical protein